MTKQTFVALLLMLVLFKLLDLADDFTRLPQVPPAKQEVH